MPDDCVFCKIVDGELPAHRIDEDDHTIAFLDIQPWTRGHALVIPRRHWPSLYEIPTDDYIRTSMSARRLALRLRDRLACDGVNLVNSCQPAAWQTVFHYHVHVIPRYEGDPMRLPVTPAAADRDELVQIAKEVRGGS